MNVNDDMIEGALRKETFSTYVLGFSKLRYVLHLPGN